MMNKLVASTLLFSIIMSFMACGPADPIKPVVPADWQRHHNYTHKFTMHYPPNWSLANQDQENLLFYIAAPRESELDQFRENVNVLAIPVSPDSTDLEMVFDMTNKLALQNFPEAKLIKNEEVEFQGHYALRIRYEAIVRGEIPVIWEQTVFVKGEDKVFAITYAAEETEFAKYKTIAYQIINSYWEEE